MNIEEFHEAYKGIKDAEKIEIECNHPDHEGERKRVLGKQPAKRNILKNGGTQFVCRECCMKYNNPMTHVGSRRQSDELIEVECPDCHNKREMKSACYFGSMDKPYKQQCGSCWQKGKVISEEQRQKISDKLTGRTLSNEHCANIGKYMREHPENYQAMLESYSPRFAGKHHTEESIAAIKAGNTGHVRTPEQCFNIAKGRKKMLDAQGGLLPATKEKISLATIEQYKNGFEPKLWHRKGKHVKPDGEEVTYRSSYEKKAFMLLDEDKEVDYYQYEPVSVVYRKPDSLGNYDSNYLIDLFVRYKNGHGKFIEIKPAKRVQEPIVQAKIAAAEKMAKNLGFDFEVWTEKELFENSPAEAHKFLEWLDKGNNSAKLS